MRKKPTIIILCGANDHRTYSQRKRCALWLYARNLFVFVSMFFREVVLKMDRTLFYYA